MAKEKIDIKREMEDLQKELICGICKQHYKEPKVLTCCHYFCKKCILKSITRGSFTCPSCNTIIPVDGTEFSFAPFFVNSIKEKYDLLDIAFCNAETKCESCSKSVKAKGFCRDCSGFICEFCFASHQQQKLYKTHCMTSLDNLDKSKFEEMISTKSIITCSEHNNTKSLYCSDCRCFICDICKSNNHNRHKTEPARNVTSASMKELSKASDSLKDTSRKALDSLQKVKAMKQATVVKKYSVATAIRKSFDELHKIIEKHKKNVLEETRIMMTENIDELTKKETKFETANIAIQKILNYTEKCLTLSCDHDLHLNQAEIKHLLEKNFDISWGDEITEIEALVNCNDELDKFLQDKTWISRHQPLSAASGQEILLHNEVMEITSNEKCTCTVDFKCLNDLPAIEGKPTMAKRKNHCVEYIPNCRGLHELTIAVNGKKIASNPISILVIPPNEQSKPYKVLSGFERPISVVVNSVGDIIVTQLQAGTIILDKEGVIKNIIDRSKKFSELFFSVAVDANDSLYFSSQCSNEITKYDLTGNMYEAYKVNQKGRGPGYYAIAIVDDEVMLTERKNEGAVMVYNKSDMIYVRQISRISGGKYFDISSDGYGKIYVTDHKNSRMCIQVFSNSGAFLSTIENDSCFDDPAYRYGIFVSGRLMYITNRNCAFVYTTDNKYVKKFTVKGNDKMTWPCGVSVCVDRHNFVYVCDYSSSQIVVY